MKSSTSKLGLTINLRKFFCPRYLPFVFSRSIESRQSTSTPRFFWASTVENVWQPRSHSLSSCGEFEITRPDPRLICCMGSIFLNVCVLPFDSQSPLVAAVYAAPSMPDMLRSRKRFLSLMELFILSGMINIILLALFVPSEPLIFISCIE